MFDFRNRFSIRHQTEGGASRWLFRDSLSPRSAKTVEDAALQLATREDRLAALRMFIPPCVAHAPLPVRNRPEMPVDTHFWQFPAITERLAFECHAALPPPAWRTAPLAPVHTYLGLPWASYIDKAKDGAALGRAADIDAPVVPDAAKQVFALRLQGYRALAEAECAAEREATRRYNRLLGDAVFSLCPEGAGPNTLRLWESLAVGAIPVVIVEDWVWPSIPGADLRWEDAVIKVRRDEVAGLFARLRRMRVEEPERLAAMQTAGRVVYERFEGVGCF